ncbi:MerR family transcriptional regulator [Thermicanus aegyptius]|uniref:MerR family transcriptional regulator n=1 Tax=Thermicanus aegyptius TaxID=94009 RepID=UPI0004184710|nr:MerR family transcriptional regulator [Thermicanus aegyptius]
MPGQNKYSIGEFSKKTNTSIRTLHFYDEIGLLKPTKNPNSGHRLYDDEDLLKLQKIVSLKFLGYSLEQIKEMMVEPSFGLNLKDSLQVQKAELEKKKEQIETALKAIHRTISLLEDEGEVDGAILASLINSMQTEKEQRAWLTEHASKEVVEWLDNMSEEEMAELDKVFIHLSKKVKELAGKPPHDPEVQEMVDRYMKATLQFIDKEIFDSFTFIDHGKAEDFAKMLPSPFTTEEEEWLNQAMEFYMAKNGMYEPHVAKEKE